MSPLAKRLAERIRHDLTCDMACEYQTDKVAALIDAETVRIRDALTAYGFGECMCDRCTDIRTALSDLTPTSAAGE